MNLSVDQKTAVDKLSVFKVGALFMDAGTGKTRAALELIRSVDSDYILWFTPCRTKENLLDEINKQGGLNNLEICGIETLSSSDKTYVRILDDVKKASNPFIICDESLKIKNIKAKRTDRIIEIGKNAEFKLVLNGTPLSKNLLDIWAQFEFLSPRILNMSYYSFKNSFCEYVTRVERNGYRTNVREWITGYHNVDKLYELIGPFVYECDLKLDISREYLVEKYVVEDDIKEEYARIKERYLNMEALEMMNNNIFISMMQQLQHSYCCSAGKVERLKGILDQHGKENVIVFTKFIRSREYVESIFDVKVLSYGMHSFGLNMQAYNVIVFWDQNFDYAPRIQSEHRIYRRGQERTCFFYDLISDMGVDYIISMNIKKKQSMAQYFREKSIEEIAKEV